MANDSFSRQKDEVFDTLSSGEIYTNLMLNIVLVFLILFGNVLIVCGYKANYALRTGSNTIILSLAISDIVVGLVSIPAWCYVSLSGWQSSGWAYKLFKFFDILSASSSTLHLTSITIDRYVAVSRPFHHSVFSPGLYHKIVAVLWSLATVMALSNILVTPWFSHYGLALLLGLILGSLSAITILNAGVFRIARKLIHASPTHQFDAESTREIRTRIQRERKTAATLFIATTLFFIAWLPHVSVALVFTFCGNSSCYMTPSGLLRLAAFIKWMQFANSAVNPFVFAFRGSEMRQTIYRLFKSCRRHCINTNVIHPSLPAQELSGIYNESVLPEVNN